eukprot:TRINITY_DN10153_c0_g1_i7.p1 TRINITY_DN10153_c0_g1~~TRINITY_DN10153_c0_g1_i7.p1  ORF type:complete len:144 (-),score=35.58 TRINITY_DN10153_c0_g1_i7:210-641(-)
MQIGSHQDLMICLKKSFILFVYGWFLKFSPKAFCCGRKEQFKITAESIVTFILRKGNLTIFKANNEFEQIKIVDVSPNEIISFKPFEETTRILPFTIKASTEVELDVVPQDVMKLISLQDSSFAPSFCCYVGHVFCKLFETSA